MAEPSFHLDSSHASLRPLLPRQCLLLADWHLLEVYTSKLWLDGLYVRLATPRCTAGIGDALLEVWYGAEVWMTDITLQGNGDSVHDCLRGWLFVFGAGSVYAEGEVNSFLHALCGFLKLVLYLTVQAAEGFCFGCMGTHNCGLVQTCHQSMNGRRGNWGRRANS